MSEDVSRREMLRSAASMVLMGELTQAAAQHVHHAVAEEPQKTGAPYKPKAFTAHEYTTLGKLSDLIVPAGGTSPGASSVGAPAFIDLLASSNAELAAIFTGGLLWLDDQMTKRYQASFVDAQPQQQTEMLDRIAYRKNSTPELAPGIRFFDWARRLVVDAYYTCPAGIKELGYKGNVGMSQFQVPKEALDYALKRSPV